VATSANRHSPRRFERSGITVLLKIETNEAAILRVHCRGIARSTLRIIWHRKLLMVAIAVVGLCIASTALVLVGPRYKGEATIQLISTERRSQLAPRSSGLPRSILSHLWIALARAIRSRATATAVAAWRRPRGGIWLALLLDSDRQKIRSGYPYWGNSVARRNSVHNKKYSAL
jgi:hypothetical protein